MSDTTPTTEPDHVTARRELQALIDAHRFELADVQHIPVRPMTRDEERDRAARRARGEYAHTPFDCDPLAGRVSFSLYKRGPDGTPFTPGGPYSGRYSAGSGIVAQDVLGRLRDTPEVRRVFGPGRLFRGEGVSFQALESGSKKYGGRFSRTADEDASARAAAQVWTPALVDVLGSMLSDVQGWPPAGYTFREWLDEGLVEGMNPADALDTFEAIQKEWRFLVRALGADFDAARDIAARL